MTIFTLTRFVPLCYIAIVIPSGDTMKQDLKKAKRHLTKLRDLVSKRKRPLSEVKKEKILETLHKTRKELWDKKFAAQRSICLPLSPYRPVASSALVHSAL